MFRPMWQITNSLACSLTLACAAWAGGDAASVPAAPAASAPVPVDSAATVPAPVASDAPGHDLQFRFEPGQVLRYVTTDDSTLDVEYASEQAQVNYSTQTWKHYRVKSVADDGSAVLVLTYDRIVMSARGADGTAAFDSQRPGACPPHFAHVMDSVGRPTAELTMTTRGLVTRVQTPQTVAHGPPERSAAPSTTLDREAPSPLVLPSAPVAVGAVWHEPFEIPVLIEDHKLTRNIKLQRTYTLMSVAEGVATIEVDTIVLTPLSDPQLEAQLIQRTPSGVLTFDLAGGRLLTKRTFLNNQVVGHEGAGSKLKVIRTYTETLDAADAAQTAQATATGR